jgi:hypothetical protein
LLPIHPEQRRMSAAGPRYLLAKHAESLRTSTTGASFLPVRPWETCTGISVSMTTKLENRQAAIAVPQSTRRYRRRIRLFIGTSFKVSAATLCGGINYNFPGWVSREMANIANIPNTGRQYFPLAGHMSKLEPVKDAPSIPYRSIWPDLPDLLSIARLSSNWLTVAENHFPPERVRIPSRFSVFAIPVHDSPAARMASILSRTGFSSGRNPKGLRPSLPRGRYAKRWGCGNW